MVSGRDESSGNLIWLGLSHNYQKEIFQIPDYLKEEIFFAFGKETFMQ